MTRTARTLIPLFALALYSLTQPASVRADGLSDYLAQLLRATAAERLEASAGNGYASGPALAPLTGAALGSYQAGRPQRASAHHNSTGAGRPGVFSPYVQPQPPARVGGRTSSMADTLTGLLRR